MREEIIDTKGSSDSNSNPKTSKKEVGPAEIRLKKCSAFFAPDFRIFNDEINFRDMIST